jgi:hypothetical protein
MEGDWRVRTHAARVPAGLTGTKEVLDDASWRSGPVLGFALGVGPNRDVYLLQH